MLNKEKYKDKIFEIAVNHDTCGVKNGEVRSCGELNCYECDFYSSDHCDMDFQKWANSEYKEPEIDWSMVPVDTPVLVGNDKNDLWIRRYFCKYCNLANDYKFEVFLKVEHLGLLKETVIVIHIVNLREKKTLKNTERYKYESKKYEYVIVFNN